VISVTNEIPLGQLSRRKDDLQVYIIGHGPEFILCGPDYSVAFSKRNTKMSLLTTFTGMSSSL